jgi:hypothetical protein
MTSITTSCLLAAASLRDDIRSYLPELLPRFIGLFAEAERSGVPRTRASDLLLCSLELWMSQRNLLWHLCQPARCLVLTLWLLDAASGSAQICGAL